LKATLKLVGRWLLMVLAVMAIIGTLATTGCGTAGEPTAAAAAPIVEILPAVKIAVLVDKTDSTNRTRVQQIKKEDLDTVIELITRRGGEIAVGLVADDSNRSLLRLLVPEPPEAPVEPDRRTNPFILAEQRDQYYKERRAYGEDLDRREADVGARLGAFREELAELLSRPADAPKTDIWGAVLRADLFLGEPNEVWRVAPHKYAVFATDGQDNVRKHKTQVRSGARILIANGSASLADMASLNPLQFESVASAIQYVLSQEGK
jgi:hypothetical protein